MRVRARVQPGRARAAARRISLAKLLPFVGVTGSVPGCGCGSDSGSAPATGAHAGDIRRGQRLSTGDEGARYFARAAHGRAHRGTQCWSWQATRPHRRMPAWAAALIVDWRPHAPTEVWPSAWLAGPRSASDSRTAAEVAARSRAQAHTQLAQAHTAHSMRRSESRQPRIGSRQRRMFVTAGSSPVPPARGAGRCADS